MARDLATIQTLLAERIGLDPGTVGTSLIPRAVRLRMAELGLGTTGEYAALVRGSAAELQALIEEVVIPESWFFRDELPFVSLREYIRDVGVGEGAPAPIRILSIPCAGGEEPYSIAITLLQTGLTARQFRVDAVDVSARRIESARRGVFSSNSFRGNDEADRARYFRPTARGFEVIPEVRESVRFIQGSILDPAILAAEPRYQVIFCRNLLIYLDGPSRARAMATLDRLLAGDGLLVIGHADRLNEAAAEPRFVAVGDRGAFSYRRAPAPSQAPAPARSISTVPFQAAARKAAPAPIRPAPPSHSSPSTSCDARASSVPPRPAVDSLLEQASGLANRGRNDEAIALCEHHLRLRGPSAAAYYLMGVIRQAAGDRRRAEECFHKAVYLDPGHDEALLALALCAERRGDASAAASFRRRAERAVLKRGAR